ncbi:MAG: hypothetical protein WA701_17065 [Solirubrobacterales bacterium]
MSEENVEIVRRVYERFDEGDFRASVDLFDRHRHVPAAPTP